MWAQPPVHGEVGIGVDVTYLREASLDFRSLCSELLFSQQPPGLAAAQVQKPADVAGPSRRLGDADRLDEEDAEASAEANHAGLSQLRCMDPSHPPSCSRCEREPVASLVRPVLRPKVPLCRNNRFATLQLHPERAKVGERCPRQQLSVSHTYTNACPGRCRAAPRHDEEHHFELVGDAGELLMSPLVASWTDSQFQPAT